MDASRRMLWLDFGKAMGMLVVLLVHAECNLGPVTFYGGMFYMPIFFVAAGYTFRQKEGERYIVYLKKKAKRLLAPYFGTSLFLWLFFWVKDSCLTGNPKDLKLLSLFGILYSRNQMYTDLDGVGQEVLLNLLNAPLWFLTAMFLTCAFYGLISRSRGKYVLLFAGAAASVLWHYSTGLLLPWSLDAVPYFACFFGAGEWLREQKKEKFLGELWFLGFLLVVFLLTSGLNGTVNLSKGDYGHSMILAWLAGVSGSFLVLAAGMCLERKWPSAIRAVAVIGQETLTILCFHMFLFMFLKTGASLLGLPSGLTKALLVTGSAGLLTAVGHTFHHIGKSFGFPV